jgi:DNA-directed RNA polymerase subunit RPC12/RpoP
MTGNYGLTCSECLRFFMFASGNTETGKPRLVSCPYCNEKLQYFVDPITVKPENFMIFEAA